MLTSAWCSGDHILTFLVLSVLDGTYIMEEDGDASSEGLRRSPRLKKGGREKGSKNRPKINADKVTLAVTSFKRNRQKRFETVSTWNVTDNVHPGPSGSEASAVWGAISVEWKHHLKVEKRDVDKVTVLLPDAPHFDLQYFISRNF